MLFNFFSNSLTTILSSVAIGVDRYSSIVTFAPKVANIFANSHPMTPAPIINNLLGTSLKSGLKISSLVRIRLWSILNAGIKAGDDPVATITLFELIVWTFSPSIEMSNPSLWFPLKIVPWPIKISFFQAFSSFPIPSTNSSTTLFFRSTALAKSILGSQETPNSSPCSLRFWINSAEA